MCLDQCFPVLRALPMETCCGRSKGAESMTGTAMACKVENFSDPEIRVIQRLEVSDHVRIYATCHLTWHMSWEQRKVSTWQLQKMHIMKRGSLAQLWF